MRTCFFILMICWPSLVVGQTLDVTIDYSFPPSLARDQPNGFHINDNSVILSTDSAWVFDKTNGDYLFELNFELPEYIQAHGDYLAVGSPRVVNETEDGEAVFGQIAVFDTTSGERVHNLWFDYLDLPSDSGKRLGEMVALSDKYVAGSDRNGGGVVFSLETGEPVYSFQELNRTNRWSQVDVHDDLFAIKVQLDNVWNIILYDLVSENEVFRIQGDFGGVEISDDFVYTTNGGSLEAYDMDGVLVAKNDSGGFYAPTITDIEYSPFGLSGTYARNGQGFVGRVFDPITLQPDHSLISRHSVVYEDQFLIVDRDLKIAQLYTVPEPVLVPFLGVSLFAVAFAVRRRRTVL